MKVYREDEAISLLLNDKADSAANEELVAEIRDQVERLKECGYMEPAEMMCAVEVEEADTAADLEGLMGMSVLRNRWTGVEYGVEGFTPTWEALERYDHWYVAVFVPSDYGFGYLVFVPKQHGSRLPQLFENYLKDFSSQ